jgi:AraC-like DNA-binding protein
MQGYIGPGIGVPDEPPLEEPLLEEPPLDEPLLDVLPLEPPLEEPPLDEPEPDEDPPDDDPVCESVGSRARPPHPTAGSAPKVARNEAHQRSSGVRRRMQRRLATTVPPRIARVLPDSRGPPAHPGTSRTPSRSRTPAGRRVYDARVITAASLRRLIRARDLARARFDDSLSVDELALAAGLSRAHFLRSFTRAFGVTPHQFVIDLRIDEARRQLARGASVTEACMAVGFSSLGSFSQTFAARVGASPRAWQRSVRAVLPSAELWPRIWIPGCFVEHFWRSAPDASRRECAT